MRQGLSVTLSGLRTLYAVMVGILPQTARLFLLETDALAPQRGFIPYAHSLASLVALGGGVAFLASANWGSCWALLVL